MPNDFTLDKTYTDHAKAQFYASRNDNDLRHMNEKATTDRSMVDWAYQLRQVRQPLPPRTTAATEPNFGESRERELRTQEHEDGPYFDGVEKTVELANGNEHTYVPAPYVRKAEVPGNGMDMATVGHFVRQGDPQTPAPVRSTDKDGMHFALGLRSTKAYGNFTQPKKWRRYFARKGTTFDDIRRNTSTEEYQNKENTPADKPDRDNVALPNRHVKTDTDYILDGKGAGGRYPGAEGSNLSNWRHVSQGKCIQRTNLMWATTLRDYPDNRNNAVPIDMLGKKKWNYSSAKDRTDLGDLRLRHKNGFSPLPEPYKRVAGLGDAKSKNVREPGEAVE